MHTLQMHATLNGECLSQIESFMMFYYWLTMFYVFHNVLQVFQDIYNVSESRNDRHRHLQSVSPIAASATANHVNHHR